MEVETTPVNFLRASASLGARHHSCPRGPERIGIPTLGTTASTFVDQSGARAIYKGLALSGSGSAARLYAANFHAGTVDAFDANFVPVLRGGFLDPLLPSGYAPFNVQSFVADPLRRPSECGYAGTSAR